MEIVKRKAEYTIIKKRSGRFGVLNTNNKWIGGEEKEKILLKEKVIKIAKPKAKAEPAKEEVAQEAKAEKPAVKEAKAEKTEAKEAKAEKPAAKKEAKAAKTADKAPKAKKTETKAKEAKAKKE
jgi:hypothetical protein